MKKILCLLALSVAAVMAFSACNGTTDDTSIWYTWGFDNMSYTGNSLPMSEMKKIEDAYLASLGVRTSPFNLEGSIKECDAIVRKACAAAEAALASETWTGYYVFSITNVNSNKIIHTGIYGTKPAE